jgi:hypothetical protein
MDTWPAAVALAGCALYALGRWHQDANEMGDGWRMSGLGTLLLIILPLMVKGLFGDITPGAPISTIVITSLTALVAISAAARPARIPGDWAILGAAFVGACWSVVVWAGLFKPGWWFSTSSTVAFSAVALMVGVAFIRSAFRSNRTSDLVFGVLFGLAFLIVRWTSVLENLLWSGLLLLVTGGGLLFVARQWLRRDRSVLVGRAS